MMKLLALGLLLSVAAGCAGAPASSSGSSGPDLLATVELDYTSPDPIEGELGLFVIRIKNRSQKYVVLRDVGQGESSTAAISWEVSPPKPLEFDSTRDEFRTTQDPRVKASESLNIGFLFPGEEIQFRPRVRFLNFPRRYVISYFAYSSGEVSRNLYFMEGDRRVPTYRKKLPADIDKLARGIQPEATHRSVVFPHAHSILESAKTQDLVIDVPVRKRPFTLDAALTRVAVKREDLVEYTYSSQLEAWAVRTRQESWLVNPRGAAPLPRINRFEMFFQNLDLLDPGQQVQIEFLDDCSVMFRMTKVVPLREDNKIRKMGFLPREKLVEFLGEVKREDLEVYVKLEGRTTLICVRK